MLYLVQSTTSAGFWRCFLRTDSGPMGFEHRPSPWATLISGCWTYLAREGVFAAPLADPDAQLLRLRRERPLGIVVDSPDSSLLDAFEDLRRFRAEERRAEFYARRDREGPGPEPSPDWLAGLIARASPADDSGLFPLVEHAACVQLWRHSDMGMGVLIGGAGARARIDALAATHGLALKIVAGMAEVPCW
jgi:hypothetical protein